MNVKKIYRKIKLIQESKGQKAITYQTVLNQLAKGTSIADITKMKAGSGGKRDITGNKGKFKLSERDFERAKYMFNTGMNTDEVTKYFRVSRSYFDKHFNKKTGQIKINR